MRRRGSALLALVAAGWGVSGCVTLRRTPEARFFVLRSIAEPVSPASSSGAGIVGVLAVRLPGHLERPQVVTEAGPNELRIDEFVRWAEPLGPATTRVVSENLAALLPERRVLRSPWPAEAALRCRVAIDIESFAQQADGQVLLVGRWALLEPDTPRAVALRDFSLQRGPLPVGATGMDPTAGAAAMSELLAELAEQLAEAIGALPPAAEDEEPG
jgi:uncharacterized lipoprotein YmbA